MAASYTIVRGRAPCTAASIGPGRPAAVTPGWLRFALRHEAEPEGQRHERGEHGYRNQVGHILAVAAHAGGEDIAARRGGKDRKSTRLNSSHVKISYAVFCLKKKMSRSA